MYQELILMFSIGTALGAGSSVLARQLARGIIAQEGRVSQGETAVQVVSDTLIVASDPADALTQLRTWAPPTPKWR